jgi:hypothetical protein
MMSAIAIFRQLTRIASRAADRINFRLADKLELVFDGFELGREPPLLWVTFTARVLIL